MRRIASRSSLLSALAAAFLLVATGCASSDPYWSKADRGAAQVQELQEKISALEAQLSATTQQKADLAAEVERLRGDLSRLTSVGGSASSAPRVHAAEEPMATAPRPRVEIEQSDLGEPGEPGERGPRTPANAGSSSAASLPGTAGPAETTAASSAQELYDQSLDLLQLQRLDEAAAGFRRFLAENAGSDLADNAQFWLAEGDLRRGDVSGALTGFRSVVERYPEGNKVPDALLKIGACLTSLGEADSAATVYRELLTRFPESAAAEAARQRLGTP
ncbi:MAG: tol-pal system protein YbgF [Thermoanaerobaculia bacterium]